jgi:hypothetical protein
MLKTLRTMFRRKRRVRDIGVIAEHERPLGRVMHEASGATFEPLTSFSEARSDPHGYAILEGDWGGQIYVTAPMRAVKCSEQKLQELLRLLDQTEWACNRGEGSGVFYERLSPGAGVAGGMGGGIAGPDTWIHPSLVEKGLAPHVRAVLAGVEPPRSNSG